MKQRIESLDDFINESIGIYLSYFDISMIIKGFELTMNDNKYAISKEDLNKLKKRENASKILMNNKNDVIEMLELIKKTNDLKIKLDVNDYVIQHILDEFKKLQLNKATFIDY